MRQEDIVSTSYLKYVVFLLCTFVFTACSHSFLDYTYQSQYTHLKKQSKSLSSLPGDECYIIFLVAARHLDYASTPRFLRSLDINPMSKEKRLSFGHAWFYLRGLNDKQEPEVLEGGHSGELGLNQAKYFEGVVNNIKYGYSNPTKEQMQAIRYEKNPIKYLWETIYDGFLQKGDGGYQPTLAIYLAIDKSQYLSLKKMLDPSNYNYFAYSITQNQCCSLVIKMAKSLGYELYASKSIEVPPKLSFNGESLRFREDEQYANFTFLSPDELEKSMYELLKQDAAWKDVTAWWYESQP